MISLVTATFPLAVRGLGMAGERKGLAASAFANPESARIASRVPAGILLDDPYVCQHGVVPPAVEFD
jgi:hypothetical protein